MNTATNDRNAARAAEIEADLRRLARKRAPLDEERDELRGAIEKLAGEVSARDWVLSNHRPRGAVFDGSQDATYARRREFAAQRQTHERILAEVNEELRKIDGQAAMLRNELAAVRRALVTPESMTAEVAQAGETLAVLEGERAKLADALDGTLKKQAQLETDIAALPEAVAQLDQARADAYLSPDDGVLAAAVDSAEAAAAMAREKAAGARAANGRVALKVDAAREALEAHDANIAQQSAKVQALKQRRAVLVARQAVHAAAAGMGKALAELMAADVAEGLRLAQAWQEGLRVPDVDGVPRPLPWLQAGISRHTGKQQRAELLAALATA